eukprot:gene14824-biopygen17132
MGTALSNDAFTMGVPHTEWRHLPALGRTAFPQGDTYEGGCSNASTGAVPAKLPWGGASDASTRAVPALLPWGGGVDRTEMIGGDEGRWSAEELVIVNKERRAGETGRRRIVAALGEERRETECIRVVVAESASGDHSLV